jgi:CheY-like chemotaxis protein
VGVKVAESEEHSDKVILVVDDTALSRLGTVALVEELGYQCDQADGAAAALSKVKMNVYALILMDYHMPGMDGIECTRKIREGTSGANSTVPIIALTSDHDSELESRCLAAGMNGFLLKNCDSATFANVLNDFANR